jgi:hypothetical protein
MRMRTPVTAILLLSLLVPVTAGCKKKEDPKPEIVEPKVTGLRVNCKGKTGAVSPLIYGIAFDPTGAADFRKESQWAFRPTARRFGGNGATRYNFEHGTALNHGSDWYFRNNGDEGAKEALYLTFVRDNIKHGALSALQVPTIGWVAKDITSGGFPVAKFAGQKAIDDAHKFGNGVMISGREIEPGPPTQTSIAFPPEKAGAFVTAFLPEVRRLAGPRIYILDNEPGLWNSTHRDVHPEPVSYDEMLTRVTQYGAAIRAQDPTGLIAGPAAHGWMELFYSAKDQSLSITKKPDRTAHGDKPLLPWLLGQLREHEKKTGQSVLDVVDVHFYPQAEGVGVGTKGETDPATAEKRIRSARALFDPKYVDESWIAEPVELLPRLHRWIDENYPGRKIQIGEWNFGAEGHMSSGLATAIALGTFATHDVYSAFYWTYPPSGSPAEFAFRAFRNFDGKGGHFEDTWVEAAAEPGVALYASKDATGKRLVLVALNLDPKQAKAFPLDVSSCGEVDAATAHVFEQKGAQSGAVAAQGAALDVKLPPYTISSIEVRLK